MIGLKINCLGREHLSTHPQIPKVVSEALMELGALVCTPEGRGVVLARVVIDGTGSAPIQADLAVKDGRIAAITQVNFPPSQRFRLRWRMTSRPGQS